MLRRLFFAVYLTAALLMGRTAQAASPGASDPSILVGAIMTLTGPNAMAGQDMIDGFNLALKQLNSRFSNQEVRIILHDDKGSPDLAIAIARKLLERERLDVVLTGVSPASMSMIMPPLMKSQLFIMSLDQPAPDMAGRNCGAWVFSMAPHPDGTQEALGLHLNQEKKRRLYVVAPDNPMVPDMLAALKRTYQGEIILSPLPKMGAMTFAEQLDHMASVNPDAVYSLLTGGMGGNFVRAWAARKDSHETIPLYVTWQGLERQTLNALGDAALDILSIAAWSPDLDTPVTKKFDGEFESEYGRLPTNWAAQGYDTALLLDAALKTTSGRTVDAEAVRAALRRADFSSTRGVFRFANNQFPAVNFVLRRVIRDGRGRLTFESKATIIKEWRDHYAPQCSARWAEEAAAQNKLKPALPAVTPPPATTIVPADPPPAPAEDGPQVPTESGR